MAGILRRSLILLRAPGAEVGFVARSLLRWSRGEPRRPIAASLWPSAADFVWAPTERRNELANRAAVIASRYCLDGLRHVDAATRCRNLARLEQLERLAAGEPVPHGPDGVVRAADLGCGDFHYAAALQQWLSRAGRGERRVVLRGIELDGHGVYRDGHSRADHARALARDASIAGSEVRFEIGDASAVALPEQDVVSLFFPFLTAHACLAWGTPLSRLRPRRQAVRIGHQQGPGGGRQGVRRGH